MKYVQMGPFNSSKERVTLRFDDCGCNICATAVADSGDIVGTMPNERKQWYSHFLRIEFPEFTKEAREEFATLLLQRERKLGISLATPKDCVLFPILPLPEDREFEASSEDSGEEQEESTMYRSRIEKFIQDEVDIEKGEDVCGNGIKYSSRQLANSWRLCSLKCGLTCLSLISLVVLLIYNTVSSIIEKNEFWSFLENHRPLHTISHEMHNCSTPPRWLRKYLKNITMSIGNIELELNDQFNQHEFVFPNQTSTYAPSPEYGDI